MLRKLLKYEFWVTGRIYGVFYLANFLLFYAKRLERVLVPAEGRRYLEEAMSQISSAQYLLLIAFPFALGAWRFSRGLYGDEGYLTHTLPVRPWQIIASKLIVPLTWRYAYFAADWLLDTLWSLPALIREEGLAGAVVSSLPNLHRSLDLFPIILFFCSGTLLQIFFCISVASRARHRALLTVLLWCVLTPVSTLAGVLLCELVNALNPMSWRMGTWLILFADGGSYRTYFADEIPSTVHELFWAAVWWAGTQRQLSRRLNLN